MDGSTGRSYDIIEHSAAPSLSSGPAARHLLRGGRSACQVVFPRSVVITADSDSFCQSLVRHLLNYGIAVVRNKKSQICTSSGLLHSCAAESKLWRDRAGMKAPAPWHRFPRPEPPLKYGPCRSSSQQFQHLFLAGTLQASQLLVQCLPSYLAAEECSRAVFGLVANGMNT